MVAAQLSAQRFTTLARGVPWDLSVNEGVPICTATVGDIARRVAISAIDDHAVTFKMDAPANTTIYYHCDGLLAAP